MQIICTVNAEPMGTLIIDGRRQTIPRPRLSFESKHETNSSTETEDLGQADPINPAA